MSNYCALIVDFVASRKMTTDRRSAIQESLQVALPALNNRYDAEICKPVMFSAGDEVQGLFESPTAAFLFYRMLCLLLGSRNIRGGIGIGSWDVRTEGGSTAQDGSAYHLARKAVNDAKENELYALVIDGTPSSELLTVMADHSIGTMIERSDAQNEASFIFEAIYPLLTERQYWSCSSAHYSIEEFIQALLFAKKLATCEGDRRGVLVSGLLENNNQIELAAMYQPECVEKISDLTLQTSKTMRGYSSYLCHLSGATRQGIARRLHSGRTEQERNAVRVFALAAQSLC